MLIRCHELKNHVRPKGETDAKSAQRESASCSVKDLEAFKLAKSACQLHGSLLFVVVSTSAFLLPLTERIGDRPAQRGAIGRPQLDRVGLVAFLRQLLATQRLCRGHRTAGEKVSALCGHEVHTRRVPAAHRLVALRILDFARGHVSGDHQLQSRDVHTVRVCSLHRAAVLRSVVLMRLDSAKKAPSCLPNPF